MRAACDVSASVTRTVPSSYWVKITRFFVSSQTKNEPTVELPKFLPLRHGCTSQLHVLALCKICICITYLVESKFRSSSSGSQNIGLQNAFPIKINVEALPWTMTSISPSVLSSFPSS